MRKGMSGATKAIIVILLIVAAYFVGQFLHLDRPSAAGPAAVSTQH